MYPFAQPHWQITCQALELACGLTARTEQKIREAVQEGWGGATGWGLKIKSQFTKSRPYNRHLGAFVTPATGYRLYHLVSTPSLSMKLCPAWFSLSCDGGVHSVVWRPYLREQIHPMGRSQSLTSSQNFSCLGPKSWSFWLEPFSWFLLLSKVSSKVSLTFHRPGSLWLVRGPDPTLSTALEPQKPHWY